MVLFLEWKSVSVSGMQWPVNRTKNILRVITDIDTRLTASSVAKKSRDMQHILELSVLHTVIKVPRVVLLLETSRGPDPPIHPSTP